jgi:hypothetical protein
MEDSNNRLRRRVWMLTVAIRHTLAMCWCLSILSETVSIGAAHADFLSDRRTVGIYTDDVLNSYKGKNRLEVGLPSQICILHV